MRFTFEEALSCLLLVMAVDLGGWLSQAGFVGRVGLLRNVDSGPWCSTCPLVHGTSPCPHISRRVHTRPPPWLQHSLLRRVGRPLAEPLMRAWLEPMLLSVVMLRDKASWLRGAFRCQPGLRLPRRRQLSQATLRAARAWPARWHTRAVQPGRVQLPHAPASASVVRLRHAVMWCACSMQVEQSRFVVRPYSMGDAVEEPPETPRIAGSEEPTPRGVNR